MSREHIIPESLGNTDHVLPPGVVCDKCNNYFARKIEGPLLNSDYFMQVRSRQWLENKRGRVPPQRALFPSAQMGANVWLDGSSIHFAADSEAEQRRLEAAIISGRTTSLWIANAEKPTRKLFARFLGKVAIEVLAQRLKGLLGWEEEIVDKTELDLLRNFVRRGQEPGNWPYHERRLHTEGQPHFDAQASYQVLHEYMLLYTDARELYLVLSILGTEYAINFGGPEIDGYEKWLVDHNGRSPLYVDGKTW